MPANTQTRGRVLRAVAPLAVAAAVAACGPGRRPGEIRREPGLSVLLVTIDTLRADALGAYGNRTASTPWMDRLASGGVRFDRARAHNVMTLPSHANILSGRYPFDHGVRDNSGFRFPGTVETLATILGARGYRTGAFISAFPLDSRFGLDRGFDVYDDQFVGARAQRAFLEPERAGLDTVARARRWLDAETSTPAFTWVHLFEPHFPYEPGYAADVTAADAALGALVEPILAAGAGGRTLVVLTSDHGEALGDHGEATHGIFAYEATLRVPLVLYQPRLWPAGVVRSDARHVDLLPTVLDAVALQAPAGLAGRSLLPAIAGESPGDVTTYFEALTASFNRGWAPLTGVLRGEAKYIDLPIPELYALDEDPSESQNLAGTQTSRKEELKRILAALTASGRTGTPRTESADTRARLQSLGYVTGAATGRRRVEEGDDPKRLIELDTILQEVTSRYLSGDLRGALDRCRDLVRRRPTMTVSLLYLAQLERDAGNLENGIEALRKALAAHPDSPEALALLGAYLGEAGRAGEAVALLESRAGRSDVDPQVVSAYALALAKVGRHREALATLAGARQRDPSSPVLLVETGTVHMMAANRAAARRAFESAVGLNPDVARAHTSLGILAAEDGRMNEAYDHWRRAVSADRRELDILLGLAVAQRRSGREAAASQILEFLETYRR